MRFAAPAWGFVPTLALALVCALVVPAEAQPKAKPDKSDKTDKTKPDTKAGDKPADTKLGGDKKKVQNFDFNAMNLNGASRTPQLLYFLERANEELERSFLERRSFVPHLVRSIDEEAL